jgi:AraC-like DNA-binding protein
MNGLEKCDRALGRATSLPRGILDPRDSASRIRVNRYEPSPPLAPFIDHLWVGEWDLAGRSPEEQRVLPSPNAHLVFGSGYTSLFGVVRRIYSRLLQGSGRMMGVRFRTGGLRPFLNGPVAALTDRRVPAENVTKLEDHLAELRVLGAGDSHAMVMAAETLIEPNLPAPDPAVDLICAIIAKARCGDGPRQAGALAREAGLSLRTLQRLFHEYVGVSPKWVIQRYRLQDAAQLLAQGRKLQLAQLAAELGYFDQAHLARDFSRFFGCSPAEYRRTQSL